LLKVFISHSHEEKDLALAWQTLLQHVSQGAIEVWLSSDTKPSGGMRIGAEWRDNIYQKLAAANFVLAILSPRSIDRPWVMWECGVASGTDKERGIIPVVYSMPLSEFDGPLATYQAYQGDDREKVIEICERLMVEAGLTPRSEYWGPIIDTYVASVRVHKPPRIATASAVAVWMRRIDSYVNEGRTSELPGLMDAMYASLGTTSPIDIQIHDLLSKVLLEERNYARALSEVDKALGLVPDDLGLLHRKVLILLEQHDLLAAQDTLEYIFLEFPDARYLPEIAGLQGRLHRELYESGGRTEELEQAIKAYQTAFQNDPMNYYCGVNVVTLTLLAGRVDQARNTARRVLELCLQLQSSNNVSFWVDFTIGELELVLGDYDAARMAYSAGLQRNPSPKPRQCETALKGVRRVFHAARLDPEKMVDFENILRREG
jgi:tetratricopeptide (TPR) repeat protein